MTSIKGMLNLESLAQMAEQHEINTVVVGFSDLYGRLMGKRFDVEFFLDQVAKRGTHACDYLLTADMEMEPVAGYAFANWEKGYGDVHLVPDVASLRVASWLEKSALVLCDVVSQTDHQPVPVAPRSLLREQLDVLGSLGMSAQAASELEYYVFRESYRDARSQLFQHQQAAGWYIEDYHLLQGARVEDYNQRVRQALVHSGIPVESTKGEWGLGQHELNIRHTELLEMADRHTLQKQCMKELADQQGISVTFMAKYAAAQAGSSCHVHLSLWNNIGNAFAGSDDFGGVACTETFRHFLGGWMHYLPEMMVLYAPTVNSYKRYQVGSWAPTRLAWSRDNRTAGFRVVGTGSSLRIECRVPGADCNPYLTYAAALASGLEGIKNRIEPAAAYVGDVYQAKDVAHVPKTLREATTLFKQSEFARRAFTPEVVDHYVHFFESEQAAFDQAVTDWERFRYYERI